MIRLAACALAAVLACVATGARAGARPAWAAAGHVATIPLPDAGGEPDAMDATWFVPPGLGPFPVVVFSHGRDPSAAKRAALALGVDHLQVFFWLARGIAVVAPVRPGYGAGGGADIEDSGLHFDRAGRCVGHADFRKEADAAARTVEATLAWLRDQPWADAHDVLLVGQSAGGLATVAAGAQGLPGVAGYVNFAGGTGGNPQQSPGASCDPGQLAELYADYGRATAVPNLWLYALNDQYWGARAPREWHARFAQGGSASAFVQAPAVPDGDGHGLANHAPGLWAPAVDAFLARMGPPWNAATLPRPVLRLDATPP